MLNTPKTPTPKTQNGPDAESSLGLTIPPSGVEIYTDLERGKRFVRLTYRRRDLSQAKALAFVSEVIEDVTRAGLIITETVKPALSLGNSRTEIQTPGGRCGIVVEVEVKPLAERQAEDAAWVADLRARYGVREGKV
jgi:hypothetical protein